MHFVSLPELRQQLLSSEYGLSSIRLAVPSYLGPCAPFVPFPFRLFESLRDQYLSLVGQYGSLPKPVVAILGSQFCLAAYAEKARCGTVFLLLQRERKL